MFRSRSGGRARKSVLRVPGPDSGPRTWHLLGLRQNKMDLLLHCTSKFPEVHILDSLPDEDRNLAPFLALDITHIHSLSGDLLWVRKNSEEQKKTGNQRPERATKRGRRSGIYKELPRINKKKPNHPKEYIRLSRNISGRYETRNGQPSSLSRK